MYEWKSVDFKCTRYFLLSYISLNTLYNLCEMNGQVGRHVNVHYMYFA